ncbi:sugar phosphate nucleotidyltransferase [Streptomyces sp. GD-15H]|uniref:sugar nucleotidyltransferase n=1 Tax=Streptomyces sp. GD-15H TaxID=3129112 RepID=UPI0032464499
MPGRNGTVHRSGAAGRSGTPGIRGILLAGGSGTRLHPLTAVTSKHLLPVYDRPLVHYPLAVLMAAGVREILVVSGPGHLAAYRSLLGDGSRLGVRLEYVVQTAPRGLADALLVAADFIGDQRVALALGDNVFHAPDLAALVRREIARLDGCTLFGSRVPDPHRYGVAALAPDGRLLDLEEKPAVPRSDLAVTGLYLYGNEAVRYAAGLTPSARGELEITDLNRRFLAEGRARLVRMGPGVTWMDAGTPDSLLDAGIFARQAHRRGVPFPTPEEAARFSGFLPPAVGASGKDGSWTGQPVRDDEVLAAGQALP